MTAETPTPFERQLPALDTLNRPFWTGGEHGHLLITQCIACGHRMHPPQPICSKCHARAVEPRPVSGRGTVLSYTVNHQPWYPGLPVPFVVAVVELDEQPNLRLTTNIVGCPVEDVRIGQRVQVQFVQQDDVWLPLFVPESCR